MNFLIFRIFSGFFLFILQFLMLKIRFKNAKMFYIFARDPRGCVVALRAHAAPTRRYIYLLLLTLYINGYSAFCILEGFSKSINRRVL